MRRKASPAFQFYPKDFLSDEHVCLMSVAERGVYITLLCVCWLEGSLPNNLKQLAKIARCRVDLLTRIWGNALVKTFSVEERTGRLRHKRLDREREKQQAFRKMKSRVGKSGADARWNGKGMVLPMPKHSSSSSSPISNLQNIKNKPLRENEVVSADIKTAKEERKMTDEEADRFLDEHRLGPKFH